MGGGRIVLIADNLQVNGTVA